MIDVAVVGLGFGLDFVPVYLDHPDVGRVALCDLDTEKATSVRQQYGADEVFGSLDELLSSDRYDAVHLLTPVPLHAAQTIDVLDSGRHCATAVPMGLTLEELEAVTAAAARSAGGFMMMETAVYQREYLHAQQLFAAGVLGELTFARGVHIRDRTQMPAYWRGFPPLKYATHAISPILALLNTRASSVTAVGSGRLPPDLRAVYDNPYPVESAHLRLTESPVVAEITQGCFQTARAMQEGFSVYGDKASLEWPQLGETGLLSFSAHDGPTARGSRFRRIDHAVIEPPDFTEGLPQPIRKYVRPAVFHPRNAAAGIPVAAHHSGSHPHLVHEFIDSVRQHRTARVDAVTAATWCAPGICAHESALHDGQPQPIPGFTAPGAEEV